MEYLKQLRKERNMTQKELGSLVGLSVSSISMYENGNHEPDLETLRRFADIFHVPVDDLIGAETQSSNDKEDDAWEIRERLRRDPDYRMLFSAADKARPEHLRAAAAMLKALEPEEYDEPC